MFDAERLFAGLRRGRPHDDADRAATELERDRPEEALRLLQTALGDGTLTAERRAFAHNKRGVCLVALRRKEEARAAFTAALEMVPRYAPALVNLGNLLLEDGAVDAAIEQYRAALAADESYAGAYLNLAAAFKRLGRRDEAARCLRTAMRLELRRRS